MATQDDVLKEGPFADELSGLHGGVDHRIDLSVRLEAVLEHVEHLKRSPRPRHCPDDHGNKLDALEQDILRLLNIITSPHAAQGAALGLDVGRILQELGHWPAIEALTQKNYAAKRRTARRRATAKGSKRSRILKNCYCALGGCRL